MHRCDGYKFVTGKPDRKKRFCCSSCEKGEKVMIGFTDKKR